MDVLQRTQGTMAQVRQSSRRSNGRFGANRFQRFALMDNNIDDFEEKLRLLRLQLEEQQVTRPLFFRLLYPPSPLSNLYLGAEASR